MVHVVDFPLATAIIRSMSTSPQRHSVHHRKFGDPLPQFPASALCSFCSTVTSKRYNDETLKIPANSTLQDRFSKIKIAYDARVVVMFGLGHIKPGVERSPQGSRTQRRKWVPSSLNGDSFRAASDRRLHLSYVHIGKAYEHVWQDRPEHGLQSRRSQSLEMGCTFN
jgi:hypothetical protein